MSWEKKNSPPLLDLYQDVKVFKSNLTADSTLLFCIKIKKKKEVKFENLKQTVVTDQTISELTFRKAGA